MRSNNPEKTIDRVIVITGIFLMAVLFGASGYFLHEKEWINTVGFAVFGLIVAYQLMRVEDE